jgi:hypothetical protein
LFKALKPSVISDTAEKAKRLLILWLWGSDISISCPLRFIVLLLRDLVSWFVDWKNTQSYLAFSHYVKQRNVCGPDHRMQGETTYSSSKAIWYFALRSSLVQKSSVEEAMSGMWIMHSSRYNMKWRQPLPDVSHDFAKIWLHASIATSQQDTDSPQSLPKTGLDPQLTICLGFGLLCLDVSRVKLSATITVPQTIKQEKSLRFQTVVHRSSRWSLQRSMATITLARRLKQFQTAIL